MKKIFVFAMILMMISSAVLVSADSGVVANSTGGKRITYKAMEVASSGDNTYALDNEGNVWGWGDNGVGQLGKGVSEEQLSVFSPTVISGLDNIKAISAGRNYLLCVTKDGYVMGLGNNVSGQTSVESNELKTNKPMRIQNLSNVKEVSAAGEYAMALKEDGTAWIWGTYKYNNNYKKPVQIEGLSDITKIYAFQYNAYILDSRGNVYEFRGKNSESYQLIYIEKVVDLMECKDKIVALKSDGTVWMINVLSGEVKQIEGMKSIASLAKSAESGVYAVDNDGSVWASDYRGLNIRKLAGLTGVKAITAGSTHYAALKNDGSVWAWGDNRKGQLGNGGGFFLTKPTKLDALIDIKAAVATKSYSFALKNDGTVWAWGNNSKGQLGDGTKSDRLSPGQVQGLTDIEKVAASGTHGMALKKDGTVWAWGSNECGGLGDATYEERLTPVQVKYLKEVKDIAVGNQFSAALKKNGSLWIWGNMAYGLSNEARYGNKTTPVQVAELYGIKAISAGFDHLLALRSDGTVWVLGNGNNGQYGRALTSLELEKVRPLPVAALIDVKLFSSGYDFNLAVKTNGSLVSWGKNNYGQLGVLYKDNLYNRYTLKDFADIVSVSAGSNHSFAMKKDGTVWAWGNNVNGQLGIDTNVGSTMPVENKNLSNLKSLSAGDSYSMAVKEDGTLWVWGDNRYGQLGLGFKDNAYEENPAPVLIP